MTEHSRTDNIADTATWEVPPFDASAWEAFKDGHAARVALARAALPVPLVSQATVNLVVALLEQERHYGQLEGVMRAKGPWMPAATKRD